MISAISGYLALSRPPRRRQFVTPIAASILLFLTIPAYSLSTPVSDRGPCTRPEAGAAAVSPPELRSHNGVLDVTLHFKYQVTYAGQGPPRYCYVTDDGQESPTLRVHPGDQLILHLKNDLPSSGSVTPAHAAEAAKSQDDCDATAMSASMTNLHFHGTTIPAVCHQDEVIRTAVPAGGDFEYRVTIPRDEPPGLYWYHPHPHGYSERQVQGGASGALIVEGIEAVVRAARNLPERVLILRDQTLTNVQYTSPDTPAWDISLNYVPVIFPQNVPSVIHTRPSTRELWRVLNAGADTIFNLQLLVKGAAQPVQIVAIDGVPLRESQRYAVANQRSAASGRARRVHRTNTGCGRARATVYDGLEYRNRRRSRSCAADCQRREFSRCPRARDAGHQSKPAIQIAAVGGPFGHARAYRAPSVFLATIAGAHRN